MAVNLFSIVKPLPVEGSVISGDDVASYFNSRNREENITLMRKLATVYYRYPEEQYGFILKDFIDEAILPADASQEIREYVRGWNTFYETHPDGGEEGGIIGCTDYTTLSFWYKEKSITEDEPDILFHNIDPLTERDAEVLFGIFYDTGFTIVNSGYEFLVKVVTSIKYGSFSVRYPKNCGDASGEERW